MATAIRPSAKAQRIAERLLGPAVKVQDKSKKPRKNRRRRYNK